MHQLSLLAQSSGYSTYDYNSYSSSPATDTMSAGASLGILLLMLLFAVVMYVVYAYFLGRIFKKAGVESWKAWVPVYNTWVMLELGSQPGFWAILAFIPFVNIAAAVFMIIAMYHIGLHLGKEGVFVLLAIFLPIVWLIWLAVDKSTWDNTGVSPGGSQPAYTPAQPAYPPTQTTYPSAQSPTPPQQPQNTPPSDTPPTPPNTQ